jgi:hypothetical protein
LKADRQKESILSQLLSSCLPNNADLHLSLPFSKHKVSFFWEKGSGEINEDFLLEGGDLLGVFDGATSLIKGRLQEGLTGGLLAVRTAAQVFQGNWSAIV